MASEKVGVIGLGYVGLPLACVLADAGLEVVGIDVAEQKISDINRGIVPFATEEPGLAPLLENVAASGRLRATSSWEEVRELGAVFVCVDTPIDDDMRPDLVVLRSVAESLAKNLQKGMLVSIESTLPPGTCQRIIIPILESHSHLEVGRDFSFVHCPERVMPGKLLHNMRKVGRVLGGADPASIQAGLCLYSRFVEGGVHPCTLLEAEITKTVENSYRDVQIAFANEVGLICEELGANAYEVRRLVNTCPYRDMHIPGAGVGGHCLPKDSWLLLSSVPEHHSAIIAPARELNNWMPQHLVDIALKMLSRHVTIGHPKIAVMGLAFLRDSDDVRNSPALRIIDEMHNLGRMTVHDPFVKTPYKVELTDSIETALKAADCAIFVTDHSVYAELTPVRIKELMRTPVVIDGRNIFDQDDCERAGVIYRAVAKGYRSPF